MAITTQMRESVMELYTAYFNRAADRDGVDYWLNEMDVKGWSIDMVAQSFSDQVEYTNLYSGMTNAQIVSQVYNNVLNRDADAAGAAYWEGELNSGIIQVNQLIQAVVNAAKEDVGNLGDDDVLANKNAVSQYCYDSNVNDTGISLASITSSFSSVESVKAHVDEIASSEFIFTQEWISGKTLINVFHGGEWGETIDTATLVFNSNGTGNAIHWDGGAFTYAVDEGVLMISFPGEDEPSYFGVIEVLDSVNAIKVEYAWDQEEALTYYGNEDYEFFALDQTAANYLVNNFDIA